MDSERLKKEFDSFFNLREAVKKISKGEAKTSIEYSQFLALEKHLVEVVSEGGEYLINVIEGFYNDYKELEKESNAQEKELEKIKIKYHSLLNTLNKIKEVKKEYSQNGETLRILEGELEKHLKEE